LSRYESLECLVSNQRIFVPVANLDRVVEVAVSPPPPLAELWVSGLCLLGDHPLVCLTLSGQGRGPLSLAKGLLLNAPGQNERYVLQVDEVRSILLIDHDGFDRAAGPDWPCPTDWLKSRSTPGEGQPLLRLEPSAVADALFGSEKPPPLGEATT
jgi:hypothetical protein